MSAPQEQSARKAENTYIIDPEKEAEMARLMRQDQLLTRGMGGVFPEKPDLSNVQRILDVACGPGGWVLETAHNYSDVEVVGIDISERMITYANAQARAQQRENASFLVMDALKPLDFPEGYFDLVNARLVAAFMKKEQWPQFLAGCLRVLRPGGILRVTEFEWGASNKPNFEEACHKVHLAMSRLGYTFSATGLHYGVIPVIPSLMRQASLEGVSKLAHVVEYSAGTEEHESFYFDYTVGLPLIEPLLLKAQVTTSEEWHDLYLKALAEMGDEDFCAIWTLLTVWGTKPGPE